MDPGDTEVPYSRTGWAPQFGWGDDTMESESLLDHATWLEGRLPDTLYGGRLQRVSKMNFSETLAWPCLKR